MTRKEIIKRIKDLEFFFEVTEWHEVWYEYEINEKGKRVWQPDTMMLTFLNTLNMKEIPSLKIFG